MRFPSLVSDRWFVRRTAAAVLAMAAASLTAGGVPAAELRLRRQCAGEGAVVKLGDVAEIFSADRKEVDRLASIELFPAPMAPQQRFLRVRELQDLLLLRGVNLAEHTFSGSSQVAVEGRGRTAPAETAQSLPAGVVRRIRQRLCEAVAQYLKDHAAADQPWIVEAELSEAEAKLIADAGHKVSVGGGSPPWTGAQRFVITVAAAKGPAQFPLDAQVSLPATVVVAARALARGALIHQSNVELAHETADDGGDFRNLADVVGKEATRAIAAGKPLTRDAVRPPILVRRGEVVTVYSRASGIRIRTMARAHDDGGEGELVAVEPLTDRNTFFARVSGIREVEVYARSPQAETLETGQPGTLLRR